MTKKNISSIWFIFKDKTWNQIGTEKSSQIKYLKSSKLHIKNWIRIQIDSKESGYSAKTIAGNQFGCLLVSILSSKFRAPDLANIIANAITLTCHFKMDADNCFLWLQSIQKYYCTRRSQNQQIWLSWLFSISFELNLSCMFLLSKRLQLVRF